MSVPPGLHAVCSVLGPGSSFEVLAAAACPTPQERFELVMKSRRDAQRRQREARALRARELEERIERERERLQHRREEEEEAKRCRLREKEEQRMLRRMEREKERELRMVRMGVSPRENRQVPLHIAIEQRYERDIAQPALEEHRQKLRELHQRFKSSPCRAAELAEHQKRYMEVIKQREESQRDIVKENGNRLVRRYRSAKIDAYVEEEKRRKADAAREKEEARAREDRKKEYGRLVKDLVLPQIGAPPLPSQQQQQQQPDPIAPKKLGDKYMRAARRRIKKEPSDSVDVLAAEEEERRQRAAQLRAARRRADELMIKARKHVARAPDGSVLQPQRPVELAPLRSQVRQLNRVLNTHNQLLHSNPDETDPQQLHYQQQCALDAVAAVKAKLNLLEGLAAQ